MVACPDLVVRFQCCWMTGLDATAGVAGGAAFDGEAGHWMTFGAGGRYRQQAKSTCRSLATTSSGLCFF
jgi:hypothetical protein